jgi:hypothetical protein
MKRNLINEISTIRYRTKPESRYYADHKLQELENLIIDLTSSTESTNKELLKYAPIATVACFETFFRAIIKELIDSGKPYVENATQFNQSKSVKVDFDVILAIQSKQVTVGEFISHILPCNNLEDINSNLSTLTKTDFLDSLKKFDRQSIFKEQNEISRLYRANVNQIINDIKRTFELRHIFCHEYYATVRFEPDEILRCLQSSRVFLKQVSNFIWNLVHPNAPETQTEMNIKTNEEFQQIEQELYQLVDTIKKLKGDNQLGYVNPILFDKAISDWKQYRKTKAEADSYRFDGGTIYPSVYASSMIWATKEKIMSLKDEFDYELMQASA